MNETEEALTKIAEIHRQLAKSGIYRGYRSFYVALSGVIGLAAPFFFPLFADSIHSRKFVFFWVSVAGINLCICAALMGYQYFVLKSRIERQKTIQVLYQFLPILLGGLIITVSLVYINHSTIPLLPGIWALVFGLGVFSLRPYLPDQIILPALFYFIASICLFWVSHHYTDFLSVATGLTFGIGQLFSAAVLYWSVEKDGHEQE